MRSLKYYLGRIYKRVTYYIETYRKEQTHKQKMIYTVTSRDFVTPVQNLSLISILLSLPSDHFKGLMLMLPTNVSIVYIKQLAPNHHHGVFIKQRFNLKVRCIALLPNLL